MKMYEIVGLSYTGFQGLKINETGEEMKKILILEDSESLLKIWEIFFKTQACEFVSCSNLEAAFEALNTADHLDILLCDYTIHGETSLDFCKSAREKFPTARIELITGFDKDDIDAEIDDSLNLNFSTKPVPMAFLSSLIK